MHSDDAHPAQLPPKRQLRIRPALVCGAEWFLSRAQNTMDQTRLVPLRCIASADTHCTRAPRRDYAGTCGGIVSLADPVRTPFSLLPSTRLASHGRETARHIPTQKEARPVLAQFTISAVMLKGEVGNLRR